MFEHFSGYPSYPIQKWYIWASLQTSKKRFHKLQKALWLTVINEIFEVPPHFDPFCKVNYLYELSPGYPKNPVQKWNIWTSFQISKKKFLELQEATWLVVINKICQFQFHLFFKWTVFFSWVHPNYWIKNNEFELDWRLLRQIF